MPPLPLQELKLFLGRDLVLVSSCDYCKSSRSPPGRRRSKDDSSQKEEGNKIRTHFTAVRADGEIVILIIGEHVLRG